MITTDYQKQNILVRIGAYSDEGKNIWRKSTRTDPIKNYFKVDIYA